MLKKIGYLKSCFTAKSTLVCTIAMVFAIGVIAFSLNVAATNVEINDNGVVSNLKVYSRTVKSALSEAGLTLGEGDEVSCDLNSKVKDTPVISIKRAIAVNVATGNENQMVYTTLGTVGDVIDKLGIDVVDQNLLITPRETLIAANLTIEIIPKIYEEFVENSEIPFNTVEQPNTDMEKGNKKVASNGENGTKETRYKILKHNGEIIEKQIVSESITKEPKDKIIEYGTMARTVVASAGGTTSRGGSFRYSKVMNMNATAYDLSYKSTGKSPGDKGYGITATGTRVARGTVAVDPRVIPLGTRLYIESADGAYTYGYAVAADTGVKGNTIDLFMGSRSECLNFGRRAVKVYILE